MKPVIVQAYDLISIRKWYHQRFEIEIPYDWFSDIGYMVPGIAAGFISICGSKAYLEDFIANPDTTKEERNIALNDISVQLEKVARSQGVKYLVAYTSQKVIVERGELIHNYKTNKDMFYMINKEI